MVSWLAIFRQGMQNSDLRECADIHVNITVCNAVADEERQVSLDCSTVAGEERQVSLDCSTVADKERQDRWMKRLGKLHPV